MKVLIFSQDKDLKKFAKAAGGDVTYYVNFMALKDFVTNMDDNLGADSRVALLFDYDEEDNRELIDDYNEMMTGNQRVFRIYVSGSVALKELKEHQESENSGQAYMFKPLNLEDILETIEDLEASNPYDSTIDDETFDEDDVTKMDMDFRHMALEGQDETLPDISAIDLDEKDSTEVRTLVSSHNLESEALESMANQKIQESFDAVFSDEEESTDEEDISLSFSLEDKFEDKNEDVGSLEFSDIEDNALDSTADLELGDNADSFHDDDRESLESIEALDALDDSDDNLSLSLGDQDDLDVSSEDDLSTSGHHDVATSSDDDLALSSADDLTTSTEDDLSFTSEDDLATSSHVVSVLSSHEKNNQNESKEFDEGSLQFHDKTNEQQSMSSLAFDVAEATQETIDSVGLGRSELRDDNIHEEHTSTLIQDEHVKASTLQDRSEKEGVLNFLASKSQLLDADDFKPSMNEPDAIRFQATIRQLREERESLLTVINKQKQEAALVEQDNLGYRAELDEAKIELTIMKKRFANEIDDLKYRLGLADEKKMMAEEKAHHLEQEFSRLESKVRINIGQVQQREKELEGQLELIKMDSESQVQTRDKKILELKRKIDQLEFNMQNTMIREQKSRQDKVVLEDRLDKIMRTLRGSIEVLEEDMSWKSRTARDHYDKGDQ